VAGIDVGGRSGSWFGSTVLDGFWSEVGGKGGNREHFYGTDVAVGSQETDVF